MTQNQIDLAVFIAAGGTIAFFYWKIQNSRMEVKSRD